MNENLLKKLYKEIVDFKDDYNNFIVDYINRYPKKVFIDDVHFDYKDYFCFKTNFDKNIEIFIEDYSKSKSVAVSMIKSVGAYSDKEISKFLYYDDNIIYFRTLKNLVLKGLENSKLLSLTTIKDKYKNEKNIISTAKNKVKSMFYKKEYCNGK